MCELLLCRAEFVCVSKWVFVHIQASPFPGETWHLGTIAAGLLLQEQQLQSLLCAIQFLQMLTSLSSFPLGLCVSELQGCVCSDPSALCHHAGMCTAFIAVFIAVFIVVLAFLPPCCVLSWLGWNRSPEGRNN